MPVLAIGAARLEDHRGRRLSGSSGTHAAPLIRRGLGHKASEQDAALPAAKCGPPVGLDRRRIGLAAAASSLGTASTRPPDVADGSTSSPDPLVGHGIAAAAADAADHPQPAGGGLEVDDAEPFLGARHDEEVGQAIEVGQILVGHVSRGSARRPLARQLAARASSRARSSPPPATA